MASHVDVLLSTTTLPTVSGSNASIGFYALSAVLILMVVFYEFVIKPMRRPPGAPPGPQGLPIFGYAPFLLHKPHEKFKELGKIYGSVFSVYLGKHLTVVLNDYDAAKAALVDKSNAFASRRPGFINGVTNGTRKDGNSRGIAMTNGVQWQSLRRFNMLALRNLGAGKVASQNLMLGEIDVFSGELEMLGKQPINPLRSVRSAIINILFIITLGVRPEENDKKVDLVNNFLDDGHVVIKAVEPLQIFPWLRLLPGKYRNFVVKYGNTMKKLRAEFLKEISAHDRLIDVMDNSRDYVEAFFAQKAKETRGGTEAEKYFDDDELVAQLNNLFGAGALPVSSTIAWAFYFMVKHPEIQEKVHNAIDAVISKWQTVEMCDRGNIPYIDAVCHEVQRLGSVLPLSAPRCTVEDVELCGYEIPKGTVVLLNLWNVLRDPKYWDDPECFRPERHLDEDGQLKQNIRHFMPFSAGARQCPGETFANDELFLFFANVMNRFTLTLPPGCKIGGLNDGEGDAVMDPPPHEIIFTARIQAQRNLSNKRPSIYFLDQKIRAKRE